MAASPEADKTAVEAHDFCKEAIGKACQKAPFVVFMLEALKKAGCEVDIPRHLVCEPCPPELPIAGAFDRDNQQVVLCENNLYSQTQAAQVLTHELIHAFDHCRAHVDFTNLRHLACTEIRAASLSGDCFFSQENFNRLNFGFKKHHQKCVKRKAFLSLKALRPNSDEELKKIIDEVFPTCFADTEPFDRVP